jgi:hypothetical protein
MLKLIAIVESFGEAGYIAWVANSKGNTIQIAQGSTASAAIRELIISLKVKCAYDWGAEIEHIGAQELSFEEYEQLDMQNGKAEKEISVCFA